MCSLYPQNTLPAVPRGAPVASSIALGPPGIHTLSVRGNKVYKILQKGNTETLYKSRFRDCTSDWGSPWAFAMRPSLELHENRSVSVNVPLFQIISNQKGPLSIHQTTPSWWAKRKAFLSFLHPFPGKSGTLHLHGRGSGVLHVTWHHIKSLLQKQSWSHWRTPTNQGWQRLGLCSWHNGMYIYIRIHVIS